MFFSAFCLVFFIAESLVTDKASPRHASRLQCNARSSVESMQLSESYLLVA